MARKFLINGLLYPLPPTFVFTLVVLAIECLDELVDGARIVALPLMQADLHLSYTELGLLTTIPGLVSSVVEPILGIWGDVGQRKRLILGGGIVFALAIGLIAISYHKWVLLLGFALVAPASGAFVSLSQATLMDVAPTCHEQNMARWVVAGSLGGLLGTMVASLAIQQGWGWRSAFGAIAFSTVLPWVGLWQCPFPASVSSPEVEETGNFWQGLRQAYRTARQWQVWKWLILLECSDLMLDGFTGLLPLYLVSIAQFSEAQAGLTMTACLAIGFIGDCLLVWLLQRMNGLSYLRGSTLAVLVLFPLFLLTSQITVKLVVLVALCLCRTGWYSILKGRLYSAMPHQSSTVMTLGTVSGQVASFIPVGLGIVADTAGLTAALWLLLLGPIVLFLGICRT